MLPSAIFSDAGSATAGSIFGGPFSGPDTEQTTNLQYLIIDSDVYLSDAIANLSTGAALTQAHAYLISIGNVQNVVAVLQSVQIPPNSNLRVVPNYHFRKGDQIFIRGVQLSEASTPAAEASILTLQFSSKPKAG